MKLDTVLVIQDVIQNGTQNVSARKMTGHYRGADKSLARPWKETSYSDQDLQHNTKTYGVQTAAIYCCCLYAKSLSIVL